MSYILSMETHGWIPPILVLKSFRDRTQANVKSYSAILAGRLIQESLRFIPNA